jgi:hypothetical protein
MTDVLKTDMATRNKKYEEGFQKVLSSGVAGAAVGEARTEAILKQLVANSREFVEEVHKESLAALANLETQIHGIAKEIHRK